MKKLILLFFSVIQTLFLNFCSVDYSGFINKRLEILDNLTESNREIINARFEKIVEYINNRDTEGLKSLFSEKALTSVDNEEFLDGCQKLYNLIDSEIVSWTASTDIAASVLRKMGNERKELWPRGYVSTKDQSYYFALFDVPIDSITPENEGLFMLLVVRIEDKDYVRDGKNKIMYDGDKELSHPGIYIPIQ